MSKHNDIIPDSDEFEITAIWNEADTVYLSSSPQGRDCLHIYENCSDTRDITELIEKDIAVFPRGYKPICKRCLKRYRNGEEL
jgi:hypothetical protein